jgi:hypothetical protein
MIINTFTFTPIDLVLIEQQCAGKRSLHLMDIVNTKKEMDDRLKACQQIFEKVPHIDTLTK